jgi:mRNA-degrading endonuclease RelE of RelBE toxin-antitoxin system
MKTVVVLPSFERSLKKLTPQDREQTAEALKAFNTMLVSGQASGGLGFKKINHDKYELRVNIRLRIVMKIEPDTCYLVFVGSHDDVRRYLRDYR